MKIGLLQLDGKLPNLALMKLSAHHKYIGDEVELFRGGKYDRVYCSTIFSKNREQTDLAIKKGYIVGGSGYDYTLELPKEIEQLKPDYDLYGIDYGIGFTSRGCIRRCEFCVVPKKEGHFRQASAIVDIINPKGNLLYLLDNNFTADPKMIEKCKEFNDRKLVVDLTQGVDCRIITDEKSIALGSMKHRNRIHIAWDYMDHEKEVRKGIETMIKHISPHRITCYVLCGFNTTIEENLYRVMEIAKYKITPFVMVYQDVGLGEENKDKELKHFARWVNRYVYKACSWDQYIPAHKNDNQMAIGG